MVLIYLYSYLSLDFSKGRGEEKSPGVGEVFRGCGLAVMIEQLKEEPLTES